MCTIVEISIAVIFLPGYLRVSPLFRFCVYVYHIFLPDLVINEHKVFFRELLSLCEAEDSMLGKLPCYKGVSLGPLRASALRALAACHYIQEKHCREKIFQVLYKSLEKNDTELQQVCLSKRNVFGNTSVKPSRYK